MKKNLFPFIKAIFSVQLFFLVIILGITVDINSRYTDLVKQLEADNILLPFTVININSGQAEAFFKESNILLAGDSEMPSGILHDEYLSGIEPENLIGMQIQVLAYSVRDDSEAGNELEPVSAPVEKPAIMKEEEEIIPQIANINVEELKGKRVFLYCTHSAETYIPESGKARLDGKHGLVNQVAEKLSKDLQEKGLRANFIDTIHDYPEYKLSYTRSRETVSKLVDSYDDIAAIFDIHRDSIEGSNWAPRTKINGQDIAQILIIVGSDKRKSHPNWRANYQFAQRLYIQGEKMYPGLIRGIRDKAGTYNQEFHPRSLLLEFGSDCNTLAEAEHSVELFSEVLVEVLKEDI